MKLTKEVYRYLFFVMFFGFMLSCSNEKTTRFNIICFIDYSGSLKNDVLSNYAKIIAEDVYGNLKSKDRIIVLPIDEGAKTNAEKLFYDDLSIHKEFYSQSFGLAHRQDSIKNRVSMYLNLKVDSLKKLVIEQKNVRLKFTNETDIVSAIEQGALLLEDNTDASKYNTINIFIFFSDMLHESSSFNLRKLCTSDRVIYDQLIRGLEEEKHIPNLRDCVVFVNGRTANTNQGVEMTQYFWECFFNKAHANLCSYDFDSSNDIIRFLNERK